MPRTLPVVVLLLLAPTIADAQVDVRRRGDQYEYSARGKNIRCYQRVETVGNRAFRAGIELNRIFNAHASSRVRWTELRKRDPSALEFEASRFGLCLDYLQNKLSWANFLQQDRELQLFITCSNAIKARLRPPQCRELFETPSPTPPPIDVPPNELVWVNVPRWGMRFQRPQMWDTDDLPTNSDGVSFVEPTARRFRITGSGGFTMDFDGYEDPEQLVLGYAKELPNYRLIQSVPFTVSNRRGRRVTYQFRDDEPDPNTWPARTIVTAMHAQTREDQVEMSVRCEAPAAEFSRYERLCLRLLSSFQVLQRGDERP